MHSAGIIPIESKYFAVEIASGTGCHLELMRDLSPNLVWQPSENIPSAGTYGDRPNNRSFDGDEDRTLALIVLVSFF